MKRALIPILVFTITAISLVILFSLSKKLPMRENKQSVSNHESVSKHDEIQIPNYGIVSIKDVSFAETKRYSIKARVGYALNQMELELVSNDIIKTYRDSHPNNAMAILYYLPESEESGHYTAGKATWAPFGDWGRANEVRTGDYSKHRLIVEPGNATGIDPEKVTVKSVSIILKKKIYYDLVAAQDSGVGDGEAYAIIARQYYVEESIVREIAVEGAVKGWPLPEL